MLRAVFGWLPEVALPAAKEGVPVAQASGVEGRKVKRQRESDARSSGQQSDLGRLG